MKLLDAGLLWHGPVLNWLFQFASPVTPVRIGHFSKNILKRLEKSLNHMRCAYEHWPNCRPYFHHCTVPSSSAVSFHDWTTIADAKNHLKQLGDTLKRLDQQSHAWYKDVRLLYFCSVFILLSRGSDDCLIFGRTRTRLEAARFPT